MGKSLKRLIRSNIFPILLIIFLIFCLFINQKINKTITTTNINKLINETNVQSFIDHITDIVILHQNYQFTIISNLTGNNIPKWLYQYEIAHLFNFYWLQNGAYLWHLQRLMYIRLNPIDRKFQQNFQQIDIFNYLHQHPEYGIIIDTASDPIQPLFTPLPKSTLSLEKTCQLYPWLNTWYPCTTRSEMISSSIFRPLITYALYDVTIDICKHSSDLKIIHYDEIIYLFDSQQQIINETYFVKEILPRLIRLVALVPETAYILLPYLNIKIYINQYIDILIHRGVINNKKRLIQYNSSQIYHANVIYSTSSPRSDLILLNKILLDQKKLSTRRELILIIRNNLDDYSYNEIVQVIHQFELPEDYKYLHIEEYKEESYNLTQIQSLFRQSRIIIGMPTDILSHIVWCQPRTHIIEIIQKTMTTDYYEISLQLQLNYWLALITKTNTIDIIEFRYLMMKILANIDA
ncbi:unnamed protein product [Adineta steineri]|uniref:Uncharacterized protein n=1 Tax=Adineta steineri TaxID=433720 RepID=A0A813SRY2_9BILA|nr:unnamed protein product [Adineta steineri]CAF3517666.1 unnamed protein product [Adineta steineri]